MAEAWRAGETDGAGERGAPSLDDGPARATPALEASPEIGADPARRAIARLTQAVRAEARALRESTARLGWQAARIARADGGSARDERALGAILAELAAGTFGAVLAAIRAGASVRGFAAVAGETRVLARAFEASAAALEAQICIIEERCAEAAALATRLEKASDGAGEAQVLAEDAAAARGACLALADAVETLADTLAGAIGLVDRRQSLRVALEVPCILRLLDGERVGRTLDLSQHGARIALDDASDLPPGRPVRLVLPEIPRIVGTVVAGAGEGLRVAFDLGHEANAPARAGLARLVAQAGARG